MNFRENCKYDIIVPTSIGIRIIPFGRQPVAVSNLYEMYSTSAETNVANVIASLGMNALVLTKFVKDSPIAAFIKGELRKRNLLYEGPDVDKGGPWGYRHQINIADSGFGVRRPEVDNDRAGEVGLTLSADDFDLTRIFDKEGCRILHISGLIASLSPETSQFCVDIANYAKKSGSIISFDQNYRASMWKGREEKLREQFSEIASLSDILIGNEEDFQMVYGISGPEAGGTDVSEEIESFKGLIGNVKKRFPSAEIFATTFRSTVSANQHLWGAMLSVGDAWYYEPQRPIDVLDRIGGGDGFVGGLLYSMLKGWEPEKWLQFGWATGALAVAMFADYASPENEEQVWSIYAGNARVKR